MMRLGFDKSSYDGRVDWVAAKARNIWWVTIRATYGTSVDTLHVEESEAALAAGVHVSPYCWYVPKLNPITQADKFIATTKGGDLPPMIDLEDYGTAHGYIGIWKAEIKPCADYIEAATGIPPMFYSSLDYIRNYLQADTEASLYDWIIANYENNAPAFCKPLTPLNILAWQFGDGRDAPFYGFREANGCALYVGYDMERRIKVWQGGCKPTPQPGPQPVYSKGVTQTNVKIRSGPSTGNPIIFPWMILSGRTVAVIDFVQVVDDIWVEITEGQWCAAIYDGQTLIKLE